MQRLTARARFNEGPPGDLANQVVQNFCDEHPERCLLVFVYGHLGDHDPLRVRTDAEKFLLASRPQLRASSTRHLRPRHSSPVRARVRWNDGTLTAVVAAATLSDDGPRH